QHSCPLPRTPRCASKVKLNGKPANLSIQRSVFAGQFFQSDKRALVRGLRSGQALFQSHFPARHKSEKPRATAQERVWQVPRYPSKLRSSPDHLPVPVPDPEGPESNLKRLKPELQPSNPGPASA